MTDTDAEQNLLKVTDLSINVAGAWPDLVRGVSFALAKGETLCIVGESGCGKSLTALALMGLLTTPPLSVTQGSANFQGRDLLQLPSSELQALRGNSMAMIFLSR